MATVRDIIDSIMNLRTGTPEADLLGSITFGAITANSSKQVTIGPPTSGVALTVTGIAAGTIASFSSPTGGNALVQIINTGTATGDTARLLLLADNGAAGTLGLFMAPAAQSSAIVTNGPTGAQGVIRTIGAVPMIFGTNNLYRGDISSAGEWTIPKPSSGFPLTLGLDADGGSQMQINSAAGTTRGIIFNTASSFRWQVYVNNTAETGANAGSDFLIRRYDDAAASLTDAVRIVRSTGVISLYEGVNNVAAAGLMAAATSESGTFTATLTGCTTRPPERVFGAELARLLRSICQPI